MRHVAVLLALVATIVGSTEAAEASRGSLVSLDTPSARTHQDVRGSMKFAIASQESRRVLVEIAPR